MINGSRFSVRNPLCWLLCFVVFGLAACVQVHEAGGAKSRRSLIYPPPPDEPRFVFERSFRGSADMLQEEADAAMKRLLLGDQNVSSSGLAKPYAVAVHRGRVFVSDTVARSIKVFDLPERKFFIIGQGAELKEHEKLTKPIGISADGLGNLYIADVTPQYIMVYDREGKFLRKIGGPEFFDRMASVTVDKKGERIYVVDIGGVTSENHRVRVFDAQSGKHLFDFGKRGSGDGELNLPRDVAIGKDGKLYVVDGGNFRIQVFDKEGKFLKTFGQVGKTMGSFGRPKEADTDTDGNLYVIDSAFGNFQIFNAEGALLMFIGERSDENGPGLFMMPSGIAVDEDGRIYVVDQMFRKVDIFRPYKLGEHDGYLGGTATVSETNNKK